MSAMFALAALAVFLWVTAIVAVYEVARTLL